MSAPLSLRSGDDWRKCNTPLSTGSNEAARALDALQRQEFSMKEDESLFGGISGSLGAALAADPHCVLAKLYDLRGSVGAPLNARLLGKLESLEALSSSNGTWWEKEHVRALRHSLFGRDERAASCWEDILSVSPQDSLAADSIFNFCLHTGDYQRMEGAVSATLEAHAAGSPLHGYMLGRYGFALQENRQFAKAEAQLERALQVNATDVWAIHSMAHVLEMQGLAERGARFLAATRAQWTAPGNFLNCHNNWHAALFELSCDRTQGALDIFDAHILPAVGAEGGAVNLFALSDAVSLLTRLQTVLGQTAVGQRRWDQLLERASQSLADSSAGWFFYDGHLALLLASTGRRGQLADFVDTIRAYSVQQLEVAGDWDNRALTRRFGVPLLEGLLAYGAADYSTAADALFALRWKLRCIGGSQAQQDVYNFVLGDALSRSGSERDIGRLRALCRERAMRLSCDPIARLLRNHDT